VVVAPPSRCRRQHSSGRGACELEQPPSSSWSRRLVRQARPRVAVHNRHHCGDDTRDRTGFSHYCVYASGAHRRVVWSRLWCGRHDCDDNSVATSKGVTATSIKLVSVLPSPSRALSQAVPRSLINLATARTGQGGTTCAQLTRHSSPALRSNDTWGRDKVNRRDPLLYDSTGNR